MCIASTIETIEKIMSENGVKVLDVRSDGSEWEPITTLTVVVETPRWITKGINDYCTSTYKDAYASLSHYCSILSKISLQIENLLEQADLDYNIMVDTI